MKEDIQHRRRWVSPLSQHDIFLRVLDDGAAELLPPASNTLFLCIHSILKLVVQKPQTERAAQYDFSIAPKLELTASRSLPQAPFKLPSRNDNGICEYIISE